MPYFFVYTATANVGTPESGGFIASDGLKLSGSFPVPNPSWVRLADAHSAFGVCQELLEHGGSGIVEPLWDGTVPGKTPITTFPSENVADPEGREFSTLAGALLALIASLASPPPPP